MTDHEIKAVRARVNQLHADVHSWLAEPTERPSALVMRATALVLDLGARLLEAHAENAQLSQALEHLVAEVERLGEPPPHDTPAANDQPPE